MPAASQPFRVAVVGGGISGLAAAFFLRERGVAVTVLEGSPRLGGKLAIGEVAGIRADTGAEALLARRPEGTDLISTVGLAGQLVAAGTTTAGIWTRGRIRPLPRRQLMGVPADLDDLGATGILSVAGLARARADLELPATARTGDLPVASYVAARFGPEVVDRLVDPLLGGVYAGRCEELSFAATLPALAQSAQRHRSLAAAARAVLDGGPAPAPPETAPPDTAPPDTAPPETWGAAPPRAVASAFTTLRAGLGMLPAAVAAASGARIRTSAMTRGLARTAGGWRLQVGPASAPELIDADAVILAVPGRPAARLLVGHSRAAAAALGEIGYASMAIITLAWPQAAFPAPLNGSGYLVPAVDGRAVKAVTFSTVKWPHLGMTGTVGAGIQLVRCSLGRMGEQALLQREDGELAAIAAGDLAAATGVRGRPLDALVSRWGGALPQYTVGHLDRVERIRAGAAGLPGLAVCGAAYDGIGIPACIASARLAADQVLRYLADREPPAGQAPAAGVGQ